MGRAHAAPAPGDQSDDAPVAAWSPAIVAVDPASPGLASSIAWFSWPLRVGAVALNANIARASCILTPFIIRSRMIRAQTSAAMASGEPKAAPSGRFA